MSITVKCPGCSASFKVKDENAGRRGKCPMCKGPVVVPAVVDTVLMPPPPKAAAPVAARPVVASKPKPVPADDVDAPAPKRKPRGGEDDEAPPVSTKRKRETSSDDDEEKPKGKRTRGDDGDDDTPKRRRRRDDDDEPKKKSKALPIILGVIGGLLLLCGGGCAGVYFGFIVPAAEKAKNDLNALASDMRTRAGETGPALVPATTGQPKATEPSPKPTDPTPKPTEPSPKPGVENKMLNKLTLSKLDSSYTLDKVEALLGKGRPADVATVMTDAANVRTLTTDGITKYSEPQKALLAEYAKRGWVYRWDNLGDHALVVFRQPEAGGGLTEVIHTELGTTTKLRAVIMPIQEVVVVKAEDLAAEFDRDEKAAEDKYREKLITVSGTVEEVKANGLADQVYLKGVRGKERAVGVKVGMPVVAKKAGDLKPGDTVTYHCEYLAFGKGLDGKGWQVELRNGYRVNP